MLLQKIIVHKFPLGCMGSISSSHSKYVGSLVKLFWMYDFTMVPFPCNISTISCIIIIILYLANETFLTAFVKWNFALLKKKEFIFKSAD